jgi:hypothetical protein
MGDRGGYSTLHYTIACTDRRHERFEVIMEGGAGQGLRAREERRLTSPSIPYRIVVAVAHCSKLLYQVQYQVLHGSPKRNE